ncbi:MAG: HEAT repeat domain-containing protein [Isosphaeraceae bacterium]
MAKHGAEFLATRAEDKVEFLASTDNWFRPVNFTNTPSGTLLILDMYRETIEHPFSIPEPIKKHLDLTSGKDLGRLYELSHAKGAPVRKPSLGKATTAQLVEALADGAGWWRETAQRLLIERADLAAVPLLKELARKRPTPQARVHALWTLDVLGGLAPEDLLPALKDEDANVREQAVKLSETRLGEGSPLVEPMLALARDADPMVRFQTAFSLGGMKDPKALPALAEIAARKDTDRWTRVAVESSLAGRAGRFLDALAERDPAFLGGPEGKVWLEDLAVLIGADNDPEQVRALLTRYLGNDTDPAQTRAVVLGVGRGLQRSGGSLRGLLTGPSAAKLAPVFDRAARTAQGDGSVGGRVEAIRLLSLGPVDRALEALPNLLDARHPSAVQLAALQTLAGLSDRRVGPAVLGHWRSLSPALRREAVEALLARGDRIEALLDAVESKTVSASEIDPTRAKQILANPSPAIKTRATKLLAASTRADRAEVIAKFRPALTLEGNREKGKAVFRKVCSTCHKVEGFGTDVGPNLTTVTGRTPEDLLVHILDPNREVAPNFVNYTLETTDGQVLSGLIAEETANAVTLKRAEGATDVVPRKRIEAIVSTGMSVMPEGLEQGQTPQDFADLISYVRSILAGGQTGGR